MSDSVAWLSMPRQGERENGDVVVVRSEGPCTLFAVVDALGHGPHAARVARAAAEYLQAAALAGGSLLVMAGLHEHLRGTRGAAGLVCIVSGESIEACGVGNVEMRCNRASHLRIALTPGILGASRLRNVRPFGGTLPIKSRIAIFSDGVSSRFSLNDVERLLPADACRLILERDRRTHDDATILIADIGK